MISVDGDHSSSATSKGTSTITVPDGFRFTVDGKQLAVGDLKPGMKGTAVVTTTTTVTPVVITEIKKGVVLSVGSASLIVKDEGDGVHKRFTQSQLNDRGIKILNKDGKVTHVSDVKLGDEIDSDDRHARSAGGGDGAGSAGDAGSGGPPDRRDAGTREDRSAGEPGADRCPRRLGRTGGASSGDGRGPGRVRRAAAAGAPACDGRRRPPRHRPNRAVSGRRGGC